MTPPSLVPALPVTAVPGTAVTRSCYRRFRRRCDQLSCARSSTLPEPAASSTPTSPPPSVPLFQSRGGGLCSRLTRHRPTAAPAVSLASPSHLQRCPQWPRSSSHADVCPRVGPRSLTIQVSCRSSPRLAYPLCTTSMPAPQQPLPQQGKLNPMTPTAVAVLGEVQGAGPESGRARRSPLRHAWYLHRRSVARHGRRQCPPSPAVSWGNACRGKPSNVSTVFATPPLRRESGHFSMAAAQPLYAPCAWCGLQPQLGQRAPGHASAFFPWCPSKTSLFLDGESAGIEDLVLETLG